MPDVWSLTVGTTTKSLAAWGICANFKIGYVSKAKSTMTAETTEDFDAAGQFAYEAAVNLTRNGTSVFQGFVAIIRRSASGSRRVIGYTFYNWWWRAERLPFKQLRKQFNGWSAGPGSTPLETTVFTTEVWLGEKLDVMGVVYQTNGDQIVDVLNWLNECYNPTRRGATVGIDATQDMLLIGTIDPAAPIPKSMLRSPFCSAMLINLLRWSPDCIIQTDFSTTPPTVNVLSEASLVNVTLDITAEQERQISVSPRFDRQLAGVLIYYLTSTTVNNVSFPMTIIDKFPLTITEYIPNVPTYTISLLDGLLKTRTALQTTDFAGVYAGSDATKLAWVQTHDHTLNDPRIDGTSFELLSFSVTDEGGAALVDFTDNPNELVHTPAADFAGVTTKVVIVKANIGYTYYTDADHVLQVAKHTINFTKEITLTNALTTTYTDRAPGEAVPVGLAEQMYNSVKNLKHEGQIAFVNAVCRSDIALGKTLTLVGPSNTYPRCPVQSVEWTPHFGTVEPKFGPSDVLGADELVEMIRANQLANFLVPSGRDSVTGSGTAI